VEVAGMCDICGKLLVKHTCPLCGAKVCLVCYDQKGKVCKNCAGGRKMESAPAKEPVLEEPEEDGGIDDLFK